MDGLLEEQVAMLQVQVHELIFIALVMTAFELTDHKDPILVDFKELRTHQVRKMVCPIAWVAEVDAFEHIDLTGKTLALFAVFNMVDTVEEAVSVG